MSAASSFIPTPGRNVSARAAALMAGTDSRQWLRHHRPEHHRRPHDEDDAKGIAAVKAAIKKPAKLKAQAKALLKKAKKLRAEGQIAKAKKLEKKAAKLIKRAKALAKKPLGVIKTTFTNSANGVSQTVKSVLKRP